MASSSSVKFSTGVPTGDPCGVFSSSTGVDTGDAYGIASDMKGSGEWPLNPLNHPPSRAKAPGLRRPHLLQKDKARLLARPLV